MTSDKPEMNDEFDLYNLLDRHKLLCYFNALMSIGGDSISQLYDVSLDEDDFLELTHMIGMNKKPLHVRRFQTALSSWAAARISVSKRETESCDNNNNYTNNDNNVPDPKQSIRITECPSCCSSFVAQSNLVDTTLNESASTVGNTCNGPNRIGCAIEPNVANEEAGSDSEADIDVVQSDTDDEKSECEPVSNKTSTN